MIPDLSDTLTSARFTLVSPCWTAWRLCHPERSEGSLPSTSL